MLEWIQLGLTFLVCSPTPPAGFKKSWSRLIIAGSVSGKGSLAGRESSSRDRPGLSHIRVSLNFLGLS